MPMVGWSIAVSLIMEIKLEKIRDDNLIILFKNVILLLVPNLTDI